MFCLPAGVIQGKVMKIKRGSMTHSINPCLITSDPIISDTDRNTPMHGYHQHKRFFKNRTSAFADESKNNAAIIPRTP